MRIELIERDIEAKEQALRRCECAAECLKRENEEKYRDMIKLLSQEAFYLHDQLARYKILFDLLLEEQVPYDEVPKRI